MCKGPGVSGLEERGRLALGGKLWLPSGGWAGGIPTAVGGIAVVRELVMKNRKVEAQRGEEVQEPQEQGFQDSPSGRKVRFCVSLAFWLGCTTDWMVSPGGGADVTGRWGQRASQAGTLPPPYFLLSCPQSTPPCHPLLPSALRVSAGRAWPSRLQALTPGRDRSEGWGASPGHRAVWPRSLLTSGCVPPRTVVLLVNVCSGRCPSLCPGSFTRGHLPCP